MSKIPNKISRLRGWRRPYQVSHPLMAGFRRDDGLGNSSGWLAVAVASYCPSRSSQCAKENKQNLAHERMGNLVDVSFSFSSSFQRYLSAVRALALPRSGRRRPRHGGHGDGGGGRGQTRVGRGGARGRRGGRALGGRRQRGVGRGRRVAGRRGAAGCWGEINSKLTQGN